jgi:predicted ATPase
MDTGETKLAPLSCFFGSNSSGKTSVLQALLLLRQTTESADRSSVLQLGGPGAIVNLGDFGSLIYNHDYQHALEIGLRWCAQEELSVRDPLSLKGRGIVASSRDLGFSAAISARNGNGKSLRMRVDTMSYSVGDTRFGLTRRADKDEYDLTTTGFEFRRAQGRAWPLPPPNRFYGFPDQVRAYYQNAGFLADLELALEKELKQLYYLGPLRAYPERSYSWAGGQPSDMGRSGEQVIDAILSARDRGLTISPGHKKKRVPLEEYVAHWLRAIGLISTFSVAAVSEDNQIFQVKVRRVEGGPEVLITDVGFGVSQILPVIVLCFYAPEGSTILLEQPEIHLHPSVQAGLADVLIDAVQRRNVQLIIESHSEHFVRRIQRRIAEQKLRSSDVALYFCTNSEEGSELTSLDVDTLGNITNWPIDFFGDTMGELILTQRAHRQAKNGSA